MQSRLEIEDVDVTGGISDDDVIAARSQHETRRLQSRVFQRVLEAIVHQLVGAHGALFDVPSRRQFDPAECHGARGV